MLKFALHARFSSVDGGLIVAAMHATMTKAIHQFSCICDKNNCISPPGCNFLYLQGSYLVSIIYKMYI